jgi:hypothetical protein
MNVQSIAGRSLSPLTHNLNVNSSSFLALSVQEQNELMRQALIRSQSFNSPVSASSVRNVTPILPTNVCECRDEILTNFGFIQQNGVWCRGVSPVIRYQTLFGKTGSGKSPTLAATISGCIQAYRRPDETDADAFIRLIRVFGMYSNTKLLNLSKRKLLRYLTPLHGVQEVHMNQVYFMRTRLNKTDRNKLLDPETFVFLDESHLAEGEKMTAAKLLKDYITDQDDGIKIVMITATPGASFVAGLSFGTLRHRLVALVPGAGYVGHKELFERGQIIPSKDLSRDISASRELVNVILNRFPRPGNVIIHIRINFVATEAHPSCHARDYIRQALREQGVVQSEYTFDNYDSANSKSNKFEELTEGIGLSCYHFVFVKHYNGVGMEFSQRHIGILYENLVREPDMMNVAQAVGRACTYEVPVPDRRLIFAHIPSVQSYIDQSESFLSQERRHVFLGLESGISSKKLSVDPDTKAIRSISSYMTPMTEKLRPETRKAMKQFHRQKQKPDSLRDVEFRNPVKRVRRLESADSSLISDSDQLRYETTLLNAIRRLESVLDDCEPLSITKAEYSDLPCDWLVIPLWSTLHPRSQVLDEQSFQTLKAQTLRLFPDWISAPWTNPLANVVRDADHRVCCSMIGNTKPLKLNELILNFDTLEQVCVSSSSVVYMGDYSIGHLCMVLGRLSPQQLSLEPHFEIKNDDDHNMTVSYGLEIKDNDNEDDHDMTLNTQSAPLNPRIIRIVCSENEADNKMTDAMNQDGVDAVAVFTPTYRLVNVPVYKYLNSVRCLAESTFEEIKNLLINVGFGIPRTNFKNPLKGTHKTTSSGLVLNSAVRFQRPELTNQMMKSELFRHGLGVKDSARMCVTYHGSFDVRNICLSPYRVMKDE